MQLLGRLDDSLGDHVASHDPTDYESHATYISESASCVPFACKPEQHPRGRLTDVDKDRLDLLLGQQQFESLLDGLGGRTTSDVQKVGRVTPVELEDVHRGHGKTGPVDETSDVTVQLDKVEAVLRASERKSERGISFSRFLLLPRRD